MKLTIKGIWDKVKNRSKATEAIIQHDPHENWEKQFRIGQRVGLIGTIESVYVGSSGYISIKVDVKGSKSIYSYITPMEASVDIINPAWILDNPKFYSTDV